jgi:hypothetical protein
MRRAYKLRSTQHSSSTYCAPVTTKQKNWTLKHRQLSHQNEMFRRYKCPSVHVEYFRIFTLIYL